MGEHLASTGFIVSYRSGLYSLQNMAHEGLEFERVLQSVGKFKLENYTGDGGGGVQVTCFTEVFDDVTFHFQIICLSKQIYVWIGSNSTKFGNLYAAAPTRPSNTVSVTSILGGASDNTGSGIARRLVLKTGLNIILACNIPKNSPMLEATAEKALVRKLISLGYTKPKSEGSSS